MVSYSHRARQNNIRMYTYVVHRNIHIFPWLFSFSLTSKSDSGKVLFLALIPVGLITLFFCAWKENAGYESRVRLLQGR